MHEPVDECYFERTERLRCGGQFGYVGVVGKRQEKSVVFGDEFDEGGVAPAVMYSCRESQLPAARFGDVPFGVAAEKGFVIVVLDHASCQRHQRYERPCAVFGASISAEFPFDKSIFGPEVRDVGPVQVACCGTKFDVQVVVGLVEPSQSGAYGEEISGGDIDNVGVDHHYVGGVESCLSESRLECDRDEVVVAAAKGFVVRKYQISCGGTIVQRPSPIGVENEADVETVAPVASSHKRQFGGGGHGLESPAYGSPLVAVREAEASVAVEEARISRIEEDGVDVDLREMYVLCRRGGDRYEVGEEKKGQHQERGQFSE